MTPALAVVARSTVLDEPCVACGQPLGAHRFASNASAGCGAAYLTCLHCGPVALTTSQEARAARWLAACAWILHALTCPRCGEEVASKDAHLGGVR